jgi:hypothetical protein
MASFVRTSDQAAAVDQLKRCQACGFGQHPAGAQSMDHDRTEVVTLKKLIGFTIGAGLFLLLVAQSPRGFVFVVDHANLLFHEAGHVFVGFFSQRLEPYGGTLGQLVFPAALAVSFWRKGRKVAVAACWIWFFENWLNIARYMADARALELPLVGGGDHDWNTIFHRWNVLHYDTQIAAWVAGVGWVGMGLGCLWLAWQAWQDRRRALPEPENARAF